jgi:class 3 adenylate cyclase/tetratricopeptide (TPR) repeat protein
VLFSDLVGSTALSTRLDPEDLRDIVRAYQEACASEVTRWDGFIARYMGDGVLVYFGWPRAHEDDAERAVRAGLGIVAAAAPLGISVRVGIATGISVVGDLVGAGSAQEQAALGETPNLAARLEALAAPDTVVISEATRGLLGGLFETEDLGAHGAKGFDEPVRAHRVVRPRDVTSRFEARRAGGLAPMVGRERELGLLTERWAAARGGEGQVVLLGSEAGLGKSRLVAAFEESIAGEPHRLVRMQGSSHQRTSPLRPALDWLAREAGLQPDDAPERRLERLEAIMAPEVRAERVPFLAELLGIPIEGKWPGADLPAARKKELALGAFVGQIANGTADRPAIVLFEDVQWADPSSEALLDRLVDRAACCHCLVLLTFRAGHAVRWTGRAHATQLGLVRLTAAQSHAVLASLAGGRDLPAEVADAIVARADGVPLFLEELGRGALESGALAIPASLQESLLARLDRLPGSREVAQAAAVLGRELDADTLSATLGRSLAEVRPALDELVGAALLLDHGDGRYSFKHALVRDVAYESLLRKARRALHAAAARALAQNADVAKTQPELVAGHLERSGDVASAIDWWRRAATLAESQWSYAEAAADLERAIALASSEELDAERAARVVSLRIDQATALRVVDRRAEAHDALDKALPIAERFDLAELLSKLHFTRGNLLFWQGRIDECMEAHTRALANARRAGSPEAEARAHGGLGDAHYGRGAMTSARDSFTRCVEHARSHGCHTIEADNLFMLSETKTWLGEPDGRRAIFERGVALAVELRRPRAEALSRAGLSWERLEAGEIAESIAEAERASRVARRLGASAIQMAGQYQVSGILEAAGRDSEALAVLEEVLQKTTPGGEFFKPTMLGALARLRGDRALLSEAYALAEPRFSPWHMGLLWFFVEVAKSALALGEPEMLARAVKDSIRHAPPEPVPYAAVRLRCFETVGALRAGRRDDATLEAAHECAEALARQGNPFTMRTFAAELAAAQSTALS